MELASTISSFLGCGDGCLVSFRDEEQLSAPFSTFFHVGFVLDPTAFRGTFRGMYNKRHSGVV